MDSILTHKKGKKFILHPLIHTKLELKPILHVVVASKGIHVVCSASFLEIVIRFL
jgi:hypothetical protein